MDRQTPDDPFVTQQLDALMPAWTPDVVRARGRLDQKLDTPHKAHALVAVGVAAIALLAVALTPQARTFAQDVWARWTIVRVDVVTTSLPGPFATYGSFDGGRTFTTQADAERAVEFNLHLPPGGTAGAVDRFIVTDSVVVEQVIDVRALETALRDAGTSDLHVPLAWDGAVVRARVRNVATALYPGGLTVTQSGLPSLDVPIGIPLSDLATMVFRASGMTPEAARSAGLAYAIRPAWLLRVPADGPERVERWALPNGEAWLIAESARDGSAGDVMVLRSTDSRIYVVVSPSREQAIAVTESLP